MNKTETQRARGLARSNARRALNAYAAFNGGGGRGLKPSLYETSTDLLTDLLHYAHGRAWDISELIDAAKMHFAAEIEGEE